LDDSVVQSTILTLSLAKPGLDNQPPRTASSVLKTAAIALVILLIAISISMAMQLLLRADPYDESVLSLSGDAARGEVIFQQNCAICHGVDASGWVGPNLHHVASRRSRKGLIHQVTSGKTPPMPQFQPAPQEMADLLKYLEQL
jgi:mono/diheme cytochrome c family protein